MYDIQATARLHLEDERALIIRSQNGDRDATMKLIESNFRSIVHEACSRCGRPLADRIGAAIVGFIASIPRFDVSRPVCLWTFAQFRVRDELKKQSWADLSIHVGRGRKSVAALRGFRDGLTMEEVVEGGVAPDIALGVLLAKSTACGGEHGMDPGDQPDVLAIENLDRALRRLDPMDAAIVVSVHRDGRSLAEIGEALNLSRERIRQRHDRGMATLRELLGVARPEPVKRPKRRAALRLMPCDEVSARPCLDAPLASAA